MVEMLPRLAQRLAALRGGNFLWRTGVLSMLVLLGAAPPPAGNIKSPPPQPAAQPSPSPGPQMPAAAPGSNSPTAGEQPPTTPSERVTFAEAVQRALSRNPSVAVAQAEIQRSEGIMKEVRASSLPVLNGVVNYTNLDANRFAGMTLAAGQNQVNAALVLNLPLVVPQRWVQWGQAKTNVEVARLTAAEARRQVAIATGRAYLTLLSQHRIIDVQERAAKNARDHLAYSHSRYVGGVGTRLDEVRAAKEVSTDQAQLQNTYTSLARAREALGVLIAADHPVDVADEAPFGETPALPEALQEISGRTDVRASDRRARAADKVYHDRWADYLPYLVGSIQAYYQNPPSLTYPNWGYQALLSLTIPFYDGGFRYGAAEERQALAKQGRSNLEAVLRQASSDVRAAFESLYRSDDALRQARDAARFAEDVLKLATLAYRAGATTNIEVIDAERAARDSETAASIAEDAARQARLDLLVASGRFPQ